jgi:hypothetical protein
MSVPLLRRCHFSPDYSFNTPAFHQPTISQQEEEEKTTRMYCVLSFVDFSKLTSLLISLLAMNPCPTQRRGCGICSTQDWKESWAFTFRGKNESKLTGQHKRKNQVIAKEWEE